MRRISFGLAVAGLFLAAMPLCSLDVPYLTGRVNDEAGVLSPAAIKEITATLRDFEQKTSDQIAVLILPSLEGESLEDFSIRVAKQWGLGQKGKNNGVLLLVAIQDHKMRIEVGYGLESALPDIICGQIIRNEIAPAFRANNYDGGIRAGVSAIIQALNGQYASEPERPNRGNPRIHTQGFSGPPMEWPMRILMGAFIFGILGVFEFMGIVAPGGGPWFLYFFLIPFWAMFPMVIVGPTGALCILGAHLVGFPILKLMLPRTQWGIKLAGSMHSSGGTWSSSGGFSSGSSGGGGFSGGGGSFGGGGGSGGW